MIKNIAIVSQVSNWNHGNKMWSFQLSEVTNNSKLLQKYIHTMQTNLRFIVTALEGYIPVVIGSKAIMRELTKSIIMILSKIAICVC